jgi:Tfp pilus assembly protein PilP
MRSVITLVSGILLTAAATCTHAQGQPPTATPAPAAAHPAAKPALKPAGKSASKKRARTVSDKSTPEASEAQAPKTGRRDPFESLVGRQKAQADAAKNLPPGKGGLQVGTLRVDGIVHAPNGMIAVVSNPQQRTYFLREGDQLYDGRVEKIAMDGISFHESGKDAFGKPVERTVNKRIYSTAGEEQ